MNAKIVNIKYRSRNVKTYVFKVELEEEEDGRWSAVIPSLPGCNAWGYTDQEALNAIRDSAQAYVEVAREHGDPLPQEVKGNVEVMAAPAVAVTL